MINKIGIMQGRLSKQQGVKIQEFPKDTWEQEFKKAKDIGFQTIEWIFDLKDNPIMDDNKLQGIIKKSKKHNITINSIIADFFMDNLLSSNNSKIDENLETLKKLIKNANKLNIKTIEIPFVDSSSLKSKQEISILEKNIKEIIPILEKNQTVLGLETDLKPTEFKKLLEKINHPNIKANYDSGNSASLGYNAYEEFELLGKWIKNIHIKDRLLKGTTVPLGKGNVDFDILFKLIKKHDYRGDLIIQGARDKNENPEDTSRKYLTFVKHYVDKYLK
jgi:L-ribulose-5-phosphate 3-epimerase